MPIINNSPAPTPTLTSVQQLQLNALSIGNRINAQYHSLEAIFHEAATFVWHNPDGATPQEAFNAFGKNAGDLFKLAAAFAALVQTYSGTAPPSPVPAGYSYTINSNGSVTVAAPTPTTGS